MKIVERHARPSAPRSVSLDYPWIACRSAHLEALDIALDDGAIDDAAGFARDGRQATNGWNRRGSCRTGAAAPRAGRRGRRRAGRAPGSSRSSRSAAPQPACRACRRRRLHRRPSPRAGVRRGAVARAGETRRAVSSTTRGPASMLPATEKPLIGDVTAPVDALAPVYAAECRSRRSGALAARRGRSRRRRAARRRSRGVPLVRASRDRGPKPGLTSACVASAPTPERAYGHSAPTAKNRLATATPNAPPSSRATIDHVMGVPVRSRGVGPVDRS